MNETQAGRGPEPALIAEATKRSGVIWVEVGGRPPRAVWHVWLAGPAEPGGVGAPGRPAAQGAAYVLTGPGEQALPGLSQQPPGRAGVRVIVPGKEPGGRTVTWAANVTRVDPGSAEWDAVVGPLLAGRLNVALDAGETSPAQRWARTCAVFRLQPAA